MADSAPSRQANGSVTEPHPSFHHWTNDRTVVSLGTNAGADALPFQRWRHFKEAFTPELVARAYAESKIPVNRCIDPFGGSGTTALTCQFLNVEPVVIEVNPFLADLIEAKLALYETDSLAWDLGVVVERSARMDVSLDQFAAALPPTFVEPGVGGRWLFDRETAARIATLIGAIKMVRNTENRRLLRVLLGGVLVQASNAVVNGKGRRYRQGWQTRAFAPTQINELFVQSVRAAVVDIHRYQNRPCNAYVVHRGDARVLLSDVAGCELAVFSPPYPNSFDYTDVYNIELWILGYLTGAESNRRLRQQTLSSHVQVSRAFRPSPEGSTVLDKTLQELDGQSAALWDRRIPAMVASYFADLVDVLDRLQKVVSSAGSAWIVVGDSRYSNVRVATADILVELAPLCGWTVQHVESCRSMRSSAQQGGRFELSETLVVLTRP
jgi:hypothetical protein